MHITYYISHLLQSLRGKLQQQPLPSLIFVILCHMMMDGFKHSMVLLWLSPVDILNFP